MSKELFDGRDIGKYFFLKGISPISVGSKQFVGISYVYAGKDNEDLFLRKIQDGLRKYDVNRAYKDGILVEVDSYRFLIRTNFEEGNNLKTVSVVSWGNPAEKTKSLLKEIESLMENYENLIDDHGTRKELWRCLFGNDNVPEPEPDAVDKYGGNLNKILPGVTREEVDEAIKDAKGKSSDIS